MCVCVGGGGRREGVYVSSQLDLQADDEEGVAHQHWPVLPLGCSLHISEQTTP